VYNILYSFRDLKKNSLLASDYSLRVDQSATWLTASWFVGELSSKRYIYVMDIHYSRHLQLVKSHWHQIFASSASWCRVERIDYKMQKTVLQEEWIIFVKHYTTDGSRYLFFVAFWCVQAIVLKTWLA